MDDPMDLLLLPPIPQPSTYPAVKAAYHSPLFLALKSIKESTTGRRTLDVALPCPYLYGKASLPRSRLYAQTQEVVANVYKLVCVIAAQQDIEVADVDGDAVDVRLLLVAYPRDGVLKGNVDPQLAGWVGPVIDLGMLARSRRAWKTVWSVETEQGEQLLKNFESALSRTCYNLKKLRGGVVRVDNSTTASSEADGHDCDSVAVGGTFDHLHIGHKLLLTMTAFAIDAPTDSDDARREKMLTVGMTAADLLAKKKHAELLQSWRTRTERTHAFLRGILSFQPQGESLERVEEVHNAGANGHSILIRIPCSSGTLLLRYVEIWDPFGPTITDAEIDTLVVSGETRSGGQMVNDKRKELSMSGLEIFEVHVLDAEEEKEDGQSSESQSLESAFQAKLSSSKIRKVQALKQSCSKV
jgi:phosphopantetheine adenylyltransferase